MLLIPTLLNNSVSCDTASNTFSILKNREVGLRYMRFMVMLEWNNY